MGASGEGPFDNDDASDWAYGLDGAGAAAGLRMVAEALDVGEVGEYLEAPHGATAVAATAVVAWMRDPAAIPNSPYGEVAATWVRTAHPRPSRELVTAALAAIDRVRSDQSELAELWAEGDDAWSNSLAQLEARLRA
jgi:hypothetical protein